MYSRKQYSITGREIKFLGSRIILAACPPLVVSIIPIFRNAPPKPRPTLVIDAAGLLVCRPAIRPWKSELAAIHSSLEQCTFYKQIAPWAAQVQIINLTWELPVFVIARVSLRIVVVPDMPACLRTETRT
jgi:hypothetical protein